MADPPVFCDGSCGDGEELPEFVTVYVPVIGAEFADYNIGVRYKFDVQEPTRCVWVPESPTIGNWTVEKLSRYPLGWLFPATEPVANRWTWRFSLDRIPAPVYVGGWTASYPRHVAGQNDPLKSCVHQQQLVNYVPLVSRPPVNIVPDVDTIDWFLPKQTNSGCFCSAGCQPGIVPHSKYFVRSIGAVQYPNLDLGKLMLFDQNIAGVCQWLEAESESGGVSLTLFNREVATEFVEDGRFEFELRTAGTTPIHSYDMDCRWSTSGSPYPGETSNCNLPFWLPETTTESCAMVPCPDWVCDDDQARDWFDGISAAP